MTTLSGLIITVWPGMLLLPLAAAYLVYLIPRRGAQIGLLACSINAAVTLGLAWVVTEHGVLIHAIGGWGAPLGIMLRVDGLAVIMLVATALVALAAGLNASVYFTLSNHPEQSRHFWPLWLFLVAALNALFAAADLFNLYVTMELMGIAAVALVALSGERHGVTAALRYLLIGMTGSLCYLFGVGLIYAGYGSVDLLHLPTVVSGFAPGIALALMTAGLIFKAGLFPFHFWLPPAHANAPAPVSAMLSALVVEAAFYIVLRLWFEFSPKIAVDGSHTVVGGMGAAAVLWGGVNALRAERLKLMVAYSTVAQLGYLFLAMPLIQKAGFSAWSGAAMLILAHAMAKGAMFLTAGTILQVSGHDRIKDLGGTVQRLPFTMLIFALAGVSLIGLPPSGGFLAKWLLLNASLHSGQWWAVSVLLGGSLLSAAYIFRVMGKAFVHVPGVHREPHVPRLSEWPAFALAASAIALGFFGSGATELLTIGSPVVGNILNEGLQ